MFLVGIEIEKANSLRLTPKHSNRQEYLLTVQLKQPLAVGSLLAWLF
jgi:hypothetical protein